MERNLLEKEIAALNSEANSLTNFRSAALTDAEIKMYPAAFPGTVTEKSYLREENRRKIITVNGKKLSYLPDQPVDVLGENDDWLLVEGDAAIDEGRAEKPYLVNNSPVKLQGWIKKIWVVHKAPLKLDEEPKPGQPQTGGSTFYLEIDLGISDKQYRYFEKGVKKFGTAAAIPPKMTAVYIPQNFNAAAETDLIIYLYGFVDDHPKMISKGGKLYVPSIQYYLNYALAKPLTTPKGTAINSFLDFRPIINASGKNVIFAAPTLGAMSQYGNLVNSFDKYVIQVIWAINEYAFKARNLSGQLNLRNIIIAAHSGGGSPMLGIAELSKSAYAKRIKSFWGFDSWYNDPSRWNTIAQNIVKNNQPVSIYAYHYSSTGVPKELGNVVTVIPRVTKDNPLKQVQGKHFTALPEDFEARLDNL
ncbi:MAG TPA: hypothetical protein VNB22_20255 [Pyrinomonadaceae bacterium]|jgi:hypothetical protein|nr:hypothetical protein [Pyrinomonadaceae bacterium]